MNTHIVLLILTISTGASVYWSAPRRTFNQVFAGFAVLSCMWLLNLWLLKLPDLRDPLPWIRTAAILGTLFPFGVWLLGQSVLLHQQAPLRELLIQGRWWLLLSICLAALVMMDGYVLRQDIGQNTNRGRAYVIHVFGLVAYVILLVIDALAKAKMKQGPVRHEFLTVILFGATSCLSVTVIFGMSRLLEIPALSALAPAGVILFFSTATWIIIYRRASHGRHQYLTVFRRSCLLAGVALLLLLLLNEVPSFLPRDMVIFLGVLASAVLFIFLERRTNAGQEWLIAKSSPGVARSLSRLATEIHTFTDDQLGLIAAKRAADILDCERAAFYWSKDAGAELELISHHGEELQIPRRLKMTDRAGHEALTNGEPWRVAGDFGDEDNWMKQFHVAVPVIDSGKVVFLAFVGEVERALGYTEAEIAALQTVANACHHTLSTRYLLAREHEQAQLVKAGKLAAGIAHNIRNPLAVVRASLEADPNLPADLSRELHRSAAEEVKRIQSTVDSLSALARGERFALERHDLVPLFGRVLHKQAPYLSECGVRTQAPEADLAAWALVEPHQLEIALTNLVRNAAEEIAKIPGGGMINISVSPAIEGMVTIRMADTGRGLPQHIVEAVFSRDLFAKTTKAEGRPSRQTGYGIGLHSTMLIITTGHGGRFEYRDGAFLLSVPAAA